LTSSAMPTIRQVLFRRTDLSTFLVHITGLENGAKARCIDAEWGLEEILARLAEQNPTSPST